MFTAEGFVKRKPWLHYIKCLFLVHNWDFFLTKNKTKEAKKPNKQPKKTPKKPTTKTQKSPLKHNVTWHVWWESLSSHKCYMKLWKNVYTVGHFASLWRLKGRRWYFHLLEQPIKTFGIAGILWLIQTSGCSCKSFLFMEERPFWKKKNENKKNKSRSIGQPLMQE